MATESVSIDSLKEAAAKLEKQRKNIINTYKKKVVPVLDSSKECLKVSGVDIEETKTKFNKVYDDLDKKLEKLFSVLNDKVIPNYSELVDILRDLFNKEFATEFQNLINGMK